MKRVSAALAVVSAVLLMGTASAKAPDTSATSRLRQLGIMRPDLTPGVPAQPEVSRLAEPADGVDREVVNAVNDAVENGTPLTEELLAGLPPEVADILSALPFMPEPLDQILPAPVPAPGGLVPELSPEPEPAAEPEPAPAAAPKPKAAVAPKLRAAAGDRATVFPDLPATGHAGTTTGSAVHIDAATAGSTQLTKIDEAYSASTFTSNAIAATLLNEMGRVSSQALGVNSGFGRGSGLEVGLGQDSAAEPQVSQGRAEAKSPPSTPLVEAKTGPIEVDPIAAASALLGQAQSRAAAACTTGVDLSYGRGYAADARLVQTGGEAHLIETVSPTPPEPAVAESRSATRLVPQANPIKTPEGIARFGLQSETRQILAPVNIGPLTLKFAGEWVLRAVADGNGVGDVFYGPGTVEPSTPLLTVINGGSVVEELLFQDLFGQTGLNINLPGIADITIGEGPRAIGGNIDSQPIETTTYAAGAVDVARVVLLDGTGADIRIGHMEAAVAVPDGGITCSLSLQKKSSHEVVTPGQPFTWTVTVTNPNDCFLTNLKVVDTITPDTGIRYTIVGSDPKADSVSSDQKVLTWNNLGSLPPGGTKDVLINMRVNSDSGGGRFLDEALATGVCGPAAGQADAGVGVPVEARVALALPRVEAESPLRGELPRTGGLLATLPAFALLGLGLVLRRLKGRG